MNPSNQAEQLGRILLGLFLTGWLIFASAHTPSASLNASELTEQTFARLLEKVKDSGTVRVIVGFRATFEPEGRLANETAVRAQRAAIARSQEQLLRQPSGYEPASVKRFEFIPFLALEVNEDGLRQLAATPEVTSMQEDEFNAPALAESVPLIGAPAVWASGFSGSGHTVAILDTGVDKTHPFLAGKVVSEACYSTNGDGIISLCPRGATNSTQSGSGVNCPADVTGCYHGTHVAGIAAGKGDGVSGVAKDANIIAIQVFSRIDRQTDCGNDPAPCVRGMTSDVIRGLERVAALSESFNIAAVNLSLGGNKFTENCDASDPGRRAAIDNLRSRGIAVIASSGNNGFTDGIGAPACISSAISVGSTDDGSNNTTQDAVSSFSNTAPFLNLLAPGRWISSSVPGGGFRNAFGTSMAAPHVAGAWAVLKQKAPSASVSRILEALTATGLPVTDTRNNVSITKPRIRLDAALNALNAPQQNVVPLTSGVPQNGQAPAPVPPNTVGLSPNVYTINVPDGATRLQIVLRPQGNQRMIMGALRTTASDIEYFSEGDGGDETITITTTSGPPPSNLPLRPGTYGIIVGNAGPGAATFTITATVTPGQPPGGTEELKADDGSAEQGASGPGLYLLNRLTPTSFPATLRKIRIYYNPSSGAPNPTGTQLRLLAFTGPAGQPPNRPSFSFDQMMTFPTVPPNGDFVDFEIANGPNINAGQDLFVGLQTPSTPLAVFGDANGPQQNRSYISPDGQNFSNVVFIDQQEPSQKFLTPDFIAL